MTTTPTVTLADLEPFASMVTAFTETADSLDAAGALNAKAVLETLLDATKTALSMVNSRALQALDGQPVIVGDVVYAKAPKTARVANNMKVRTFVADKALVNPTTGRAITAAQTVEAVKRAIDITFGLYVTDSSKPNQTKMKALGGDVDDFIGTVNKGHEIKTVTLSKGD